jgi:hypothetical protein
VWSFKPKVASSNLVGRIPPLAVICRNLARWLELRLLVETVAEDSIAMLAADVLELTDEMRRRYPGW